MSLSKEIEKRFGKSLDSEGFAVMNFILDQAAKECDSELAGADRVKQKWPDARLLSTGEGFWMIARPDPNDHGYNCYIPLSAQVGDGAEAWTDAASRL